MSIDPQQNIPPKIDYSYVNDQGACSYLSFSLDEAVYVYYKVVESKRGKPVLLYVGYKFHQTKIYQNTDIFDRYKNYNRVEN